ncbi:MAG: hypothetical protein WDO73_29860 [Ignavibacteriota bacterium]
MLGNKSEDGLTVTAESIYAGEFRQLAATVVSVNAATGEMQGKGSGHQEAADHQSGLRLDIEETRPADGYHAGAPLRRRPRWW